jgi:proteasome lid subunit RPN8/RPN11
LQKFITELALKDNPIETCGYLAGTGNEVKKIYPMRNTDNSRIKYSFDPEQQFKVVKDTRKKKLNLIGVYHSHPTTHARMSKRDLKFVHDPEMFYVIVSIVSKVPVIKAFNVIDGKPIEIKILN